MFNLLVVLIIGINLQLQWKTSAIEWICIDFGNFSNILNGLKLKLKILKQNK